MIESVTLFRPVGANELRLIEATGMRAFPPRLPEQPIFYPVTNGLRGQDRSRLEHEIRTENGIRHAVRSA